MGNGRIVFVDIWTDWDLEQFFQIITINTSLPENRKLCTDRQIFFVQGDNNTLSCFRVNENMMTTFHPIQHKSFLLQNFDDVFGLEAW